MRRIPNLERDAFLGMPKAIFSRGAVPAWNVLESTQRHPLSSWALSPCAGADLSPESSQPSVRRSRVPGRGPMLWALRAVLPKHLCVISIYHGDSLVSVEKENKITG